MTNILHNSVLGPVITSSLLRTYQKGQTIVYPGTDDSVLYVLKQGAVTLETINRKGERNILYIFSPPTLFPMTPFTDDSVSSSWFYTALTKTEVYVVSYRLVKETLASTDGLAAYKLLITQLLQEYNELLFHISDHSKTDSRIKIISTLLFLCKYHTNARSSVWRQIRFPVNQELIANMTGSTRETISVLFKELTERKVIRMRGRQTLEINIRKLNTYDHF